MRRLGLEVYGSYHRYISTLVKKYNLDTSHFKNGGQVRSNLTKLPWQQVLVCDKLVRTSLLKRALLESGVKYECTGCGLAGIWRSKKLVLQIEHKNGIRSDNRKENLEFLCPNCHSQTATYGRIKSDTLRRRCKCGKPISSNKSKMCIICWRNHERLSGVKNPKCPSRQELEKLVWETPALSLAKQFGVSNSTISVWCKRLDIRTPPVLGFLSYIS